MSSHWKSPIKSWLIFGVEFWSASFEYSIDLRAAKQWLYKTGISTWDPFLREQTMQIYGNFAGFPENNSA